MVYVLYWFLGFKHQGIKYLTGHLFPAGVPLALYILVTPIELVQILLVRPFSLAVRLLANMMAGHILLTALALLTAYTLENAPIIALGPFAPQRRGHRVRAAGGLPAGLHLHPADRRLHRRFTTRRALGETDMHDLLIAAQAGRRAEGRPLSPSVPASSTAPRPSARASASASWWATPSPRWPASPRWPDRSARRCSSVSRSPRRSPCSGSSSSSSPRARRQSCISQCCSRPRHAENVEATNPIVPDGEEILWGSICFAIVFALLAWKAWPAIKKALADREDEDPGGPRGRRRRPRPRPRPSWRSTSSSSPRRATRPARSSRRRGSRRTRCART